MSLSSRCNRLAGLLAVLWTSTALAGCVHGRNTVAGRITPEHFRFTTVIEMASRTLPDGWRAVCIRARITEGDSGATDVCQFEVGLPLRTGQQGDISLRESRWISAELANQAAYRVLAEAQPGEMIAVHCIRFKRRYERLLKEEIAGARVSECRTPGIETVHFDIARSPTR